MKLAVIIGVAQMIFGLIIFIKKKQIPEIKILGIFLKGMNTFHFSEPIDFIFEVIPQMLFMICTFG